MVHRTFLIGRSSDCELEIRGHPEVSRRHAELTIADGKEMLLIDRKSKGGTWVQREGAWVAVRQDLIDDATRIRFAGFEITGAQLRRAALADEAPRPRQPAPGPAPTPGGDLLIRRNPETGEVLYG